MTIRDPRIAPLMEMLTASGLGWLADELDDAIQNSGEPTESTNTLELTRQLVSEGRLEQTRSEAPVPEAEDGPEGDAQIEWAVDYVVSRLDDASQMLAAALGNLRSIVDRQTSVPSRMFRDIVVVITDDESPIELTSANVSAAREATGTLRFVLEQWRDAAIAGAGDEG